MLRRLFTTAACVACLAWTAGPALEAQDSPELEGRTVRRLLLSSDGPLSRITRADLFKLIEVREGEPFYASAGRTTVKRLHATRIFHDVQVRAEPTENGQVDVSLLLIRRYFIRNLGFEGDLKLAQRQLRRAPTLRAGRPFESDQLEESVARVQTLYQRHGFFQAAIAPEFVLDDEQAELDVTFRIDAGDQARVGDMTLDAADELDESELSDLIESQPGTPYSEIRLEQDLERLQNYLAVRGYLQALAFVPGGALYQPQQNRVDLVFRILPRDRTHIKIVGLDWSSGRLARLPLFQQGGAVGAFLEETVEEIRNQLEQEGYFLARVNQQGDGTAQSAEEIRIVVERGSKQELEAVELEGHRPDDTENLRSLLSVEAAGWFGRGRYTTRLARQDRDRIRAHYQQQGFLDAEVRFELTSSAPGKVRLHFSIDEKDRYRVSQVEIVGESSIDEETIRREIQTRPGDPFSPFQVAQDRTAIAALYEDRGFRQVELRSQLERLAGHEVSVRFFIVEGEQSFVDEVVVTGRRRTREPVIRREIHLEAGSPLSLQDSLQTEADLYNLAVFNRVQIHEAPSFKQDQTRLAVIQLEEAKRFTLVYGIGYSSFEGPRGTLGITDNNFLGQARSLSLATRLGQRRQRANLTYTVPRFSRWRLPTVFSLSADNEEAQTRRSGNTRAIRGRPFDSFTLGASISAERRLSRRESLFFRYQFEQANLTIPANLAAPLEFFREEERLRLSSLGLSYLNDSRDSASDPQKGFFLSGDLSVAPRFLGSEEQLGRIFLQGQYYRELTADVVWASALRVGAVGPFGAGGGVPISQRFFSGGASTLRGLPQDLAGPLLRDETGAVVLVDEDGNPDPDGRPVPLGGDALVILNTEIRFPIWKLLRGAVFYDVGNVFTEWSDFSFGGLSHAPGIGFHFSTPIGPLRFDIGFNPDPPAVVGFSNFNFHVTLGHPF